MQGLCTKHVVTPATSMDPNFLNKSPKGLIKGLEKVLLESSRALANLTVPSEYSDEESDKGTYICIVLQITNVSY